MKKFLALIMALVLCLSMASAALADGPAGDQVHAGTLPYTSEQAAKITITGLHTGGADDDTKLPSEYHVRVKWDITNGVYKATKTDGKDGFQNYDWDCVKLEYKVRSVGAAESDVREGNWEVTPSVTFEVTNASTPDLNVYATPSLKGTNNWASLLKATTIEAQNTTIGTKLVPPVLLAKMGTGVNSYEENKGRASHNVYAYTYELNWNYDALNALALQAFASGTGTQELSNTFVVTISAGTTTTVDD